MSEDGFYTDPKKRPWWLRWFFLRSDRTETKLSQYAEFPKIPAVLPVSSDVRMWQKALDDLQPFIRTMRNDIDALDIHELTFDMLGAGTFLLQMDLLLIKIRQHYSNYERRKKDLNQAIPTIQVILNKVEQSCLQCHSHVVMLNFMLRNTTMRDLNRKDVIQEVRNLEEESKSLTQCMFTLNDMILKHDPIYQLFETELLEALMKVEQKDLVPSGLYKTNTQNIQNVSMRQKAQEIKDPNQRQIGFSLIAFYEGLKSTSLIFDNDSVTAALDHLREHVEFYLEQSISSASEEALFDAIHQVALDLEGLRFVKIEAMVEKAKTTNKQLKLSLSHSDFGKKYLETFEMTTKDKFHFRHHGIHNNKK
jgi:hypothetical protein